MKKVVLIATGGTIASSWDASHDDVRTSVLGADLAGKITTPGVEVETRDYCNLGSYRLALEDAFGLAALAQQELRRDDVAGVVITHGTDTMEESAYMADLLVRSDKPVVFTGAQFNADQPDSDGPRNLNSAIRVAATPSARGLGCLLVFDGEIHAASLVRKTHAHQLHAFQSPGFGKLGYVDGESVFVLQHPVRAPRFDVDSIESNVDMIRLCMGMDGRFIHCAMEHDTKGLVIDGFGRGNVTPGIYSALQKAVDAGIPTLITTRCQEGRVEPVYGAGGGKDLERMGVIFAGSLCAIKARVLLSVILKLTRDPVAVGSMVHQIINPVAEAA